MTELYGKKRSQIQTALTTAQNNLSELELDIEGIAESLKRFHRQNTAAYKHTINAASRVDQLKKQIDALAATALDIEEQWGQFRDEALYWESINDVQ